MPEGPEVRRAADRINSALAGKILQEVECTVATVAQIAPSMVGKRFEQVETRGKAFLLYVEAHDPIYVHLQLYGRWVISRTTTVPQSNRSLRLRFSSGSKQALLYSATDVGVLKRGHENRHPYISRLGPDILRPNLYVNHIGARLRSKAFRRRRLAGLLLNQGFIAGIGNYMRSEILFIAGINPMLRPADLTSEQCSSLAHAILTVGQRAYQQNGVTTAPELIARAKLQRQRKRTYRHYVFARKGLPCRTCASTIEKITLGGRRLYWCPQCQA